MGKMPFPWNIALSQLTSKVYFLSLNPVVWFLGEIITFTDYVSCTPCDLTIIKNEVFLYHESPNNL